MFMFLVQNTIHEAQRPQLPESFEPHPFPESDLLSASLASDPSFSSSLVASDVAVLGAEAKAIPFAA